MTRAEVGNLLHLKSQIVRLLQYETQREPQNYRQVQKLQLFRKRFLYFYLQKEPQLGVQRAQVADPWTWATKSRLRIVRKPNFRVNFQKAFNALFQIVVS